MTLLIDNYDSFTYNLYQYVEQLGYRCEVRYNDRISCAEIEKMQPRQIILSPGPGRPEDAGVTLEVIRRFAGKIPILGVCLGHQAIGQAFGAQVVRAAKPCHGKVARIYHEGKGSFANVPSPFKAARYHSLVIDEDSLPQCLEVTARTEDGMVMGVRHKIFEVSGFQFHPESFATEHGFTLLNAFLSCKPEGRKHG